MPTTTRSAHASVHGASHGVGVVKEEHRAGAVGNGTVGGKKSSTTMSTDQKENSIVVVGSGIGGVMMTCVIFLLFVVEIRIIDLCNIVDLGITSGLIGHDPRDARRLEGGRVRVLLRDHS